MDKIKIRIGTRGSDLALWQAHHVKDRLLAAGAEVEITIFKTQGDKIQHLSLDKLEGKGFFTKELEDALLQNHIDLAVHSHKDLPTVNPEGLSIAAVSEREDPSELLLIRKESCDLQLAFNFKKNTILGTSSARRKVQMKQFRPDIELKDIRGNVPTRIDKLRRGEFDAILLAKAGVERLKLDLSDLVVIELDPRQFVPAPAQGVLALQIREDDSLLNDFLKKVIHDDAVSQSISVERKILNLFEGGCHMPLGAYTIFENNRYKLWAAKANNDTELPNRLYLESSNVEQLAEKAVKLFNQKILKGKKIFISQESKLESLLSTQLNIEEAELLATSGIETEAIDFNIEHENFDVVFFNSKNAVQYFFKSSSINENVLVAAFGDATAQELKNLNIRVDFMGTSSDPYQVATQFNNTFTSSKKILFPLAEQSLKSVIEILKDNHEIIERIVYRSKAKQNIELPEADIYVFTSPSNFNAFVNKSMLQHKLIVAIGPSTADAISSANYTCHAIAQRADDLGIYHAIYAAESAHYE